MKLPSLCDKYGDVEDALRLIETAQRETDMRRHFGTWYGYELFVARRGE